MHEEINPFDILSGKVVKNCHGIFYFKEVGNNIGDSGWPAKKNLHREDGPAYFDKFGLKQWFINGKKHRDNDLPAMEWGDGTKEWFINGDRHRTDGPAYIGRQYKEYWINGNSLTGEEFNEYVKRNKPI